MEATAASGTIYKWIGINKQSSFPEEVKEHVRQEL
jgi:hypothetical protein